MSIIDFVYIWYYVLQKQQWKEVKRLQQESDQDGNISLGKQGISQHMDGMPP